MDKHEPRPVPTYPDEILPDRWYCLHCEQHRISQETIHIHVKNQHEKVYPENGEDYGDGVFVARKLQQRVAWEVGQMSRFHNAIESLRGADDFSFEAGG